MAPKLSQEEFDEAVKTNIEDFDMEADEAVASAVEEFKLQGYNLDGIIRSSTGGNTDSHPVAVATRELSTAAAAATDACGLQEKLSALMQHFKGLSSSDMQQALAVANKEGSVAALLAAAQAAVHLSSSSSSSTGAISTAVLVPSLRGLRLLMQLPDCRASFLSSGGPQLLLQLLQDNCKELSTTQQQPEQEQQQYQLAAAAAALAEAAAWQDEDGKCIFMQDGVAAAVSTLLAHIGTNKSVQHSDSGVASAAAAAAAAAAGVLRALTTADDERPPSSKAFLHARQLAGNPHNALSALLPVLQQLQGCDPLPAGHLTAVMAAVRQVAANDEICKSFAEAGGVSVLLQLLSAATEAGPPELVRGAAAALRQLANSDSIKAQLAEEGVLPVLMRAVRVYGPSQPGVQEALLGLLVAMVLRMPDISTAAAEAGAVETLTEVLTAAPAMAAAAAKAKAAAATAGSNGAAAGSNGVAAGSKDTAEADQDVDDLASRVFGVGISSSGSNGGSAAAAQRQACMAVRNMVVRNPELHPAFLAAGCEGLLRGVKGLFPGACKDVGSAALRDLGLDNYQD